MSIRFTQAIPLVFVWLWSTGFINAKYALPYIEPFYFLLLRMIFTACSFLILIILFKRNWPSVGAALMQIVIGIFLHGFYLGGVFYAIHIGMPAGISSIFVGLHPALTAFLGFLLLAQKLDVKQITGLVLGFSGLLLVVSGANNIDGSMLSVLGIFVCIVSLIGISTSNLLQKRYAQSVPLLSGTFYQYIGAILVFIPMTLWLEDQIITLTFELVAAMIWSVLALSVGAVLLLMYMIREGEAARVASYFYLVPLVTVIQTFVLFSEYLTPMAILGCMLSAIGVYLIVWRKSV